MPSRPVKPYPYMCLFAHQPTQPPWLRVTCKLTADWGTTNWDTPPPPLLPLSLSSLSLSPVEVKHWPSGEIRGSRKGIKESIPHHRSVLVLISPGAWAVHTLIPKGLSTYIPPPPPNSPLIGIIRTLVILYRGTSWFISNLCNTCLWMCK